MMKNSGVRKSGIKKEGKYILLMLFTALIVSNVLLWSFFDKLKDTVIDVENELAREKRVHFRESQTTTSQRDVNDFCADLCRDRNYDGWNSGTPVHNGSVFIYECECYMVVR